MLYLLLGKEPTMTMKRPMAKRMIIMLICVALGWFYLRMMIAGRETYAIGGNEEAARFSGLRVGWVKVRTYALAGLAAGTRYPVALALVLPHVRRRRHPGLLVSDWAECLVMAAGSLRHGCVLL